MSDGTLRALGILIALDFLGELAASDDDDEDDA